VTGARRALQGLKKMDAHERRRIRYQLLRDARRIRRTQQAVASIEQRLQEVRSQIRALKKAGKRKKKAPATGRPTVRPRLVPAAAAPAGGNARPTRSD
jgi:hypothetical protein